MVEGRTARRSHSRKKGHVVEPRRRMPKASGWTERSLSRWRKCLAARMGGSSCASSQSREWACFASAATKPWTAAV